MSGRGGSTGERTVAGLPSHRSPPDDLRPIDWRFFLKRYVWRVVLVGPHAPADVVSALALSAEMLLLLGSEDDAEAMDLSSVELAVLGMEDTPTFSSVAPRGDLAHEACIVVFEAGWTLAAAGTGNRIGQLIRGLGRSSFSRAPRTGYPSDWPFRSCFEISHALLPDDYRVVHYPASSSRVRDFVWNTLSPPRTGKGRLARARVWPLSLGLLPLLRERRLTIWSKGVCLHPRAATMMVLAGELGENNPAVVLDLGAQAPGLMGGADASQNGPTLTKIARAAGGGASLRRERRKLERLATRRPALHEKAADVRPSWPELPNLKQPAILGSPLDRLPAAGRIDAVYRFASAHSDLMKAEQALVDQGVLRPPRIEAWMESIAAAAGRHLPLAPAEHDFLKALPLSLSSGGLALRYGQQDAHFRNILVEHGHPRLIDWASGGWALPGDDLVYLVVHLLFHEARRPYALQEVWVIERFLIDPVHRPAWVTEVLSRPARELRLDAEAFGLLVSSIWLRRAVRWVFEARREPHRHTQVALHLAAWRALREAGPHAWVGVCRRD